MIIQPRTRGFICLTCHPVGTANNVKKQIQYVQSQGSIENGPKKVLVIGASTGFGLSSRITAAYGSGAATIGVFHGKAPSKGKTANAGWYNTAAFENDATQDGLYAKSVHGDAFSMEVKEETAALIKKDLGTVDLIVYSLAAPKRLDPISGTNFSSVLKPIGAPFSNKTVDFHAGTVSNITIQPVEKQEEIDNTIKVMGGEDWKLWIEVLEKAGVLAENVKTVAYSYIGPELTFPIYKNGTIGQAKIDLEKTVPALNDLMKDVHGTAYVSVNKALVTQSSSAIPVVPLYISLLYKIMKEKGIHEGTIEQAYRLFKEKLYTADGTVPVDEAGRIRIDDWEMRDDVQAEVSKLWEIATSENLAEISDIEGYRNEFFELFGFNDPTIDYDVEVDEIVPIASLEK